MPEEFRGLESGERRVVGIGGKDHEERVKRVRELIEQRVPARGSV